MSRLNPFPLSISILDLHKKMRFKDFLNNLDTMPNFELLS